MAFVTGGSKNSSSLLVLRGTMPGKIINWLGAIVDSAHGHEMLAQIRQCLEDSGRESETSAGHFLLYMLIGARWLGHCMAGAE